MLEMLKQTGRPEMVVGWYHSHPGFGTWLSGVDINTQMSFEALHKRAVAVVVDPVQSVKGKVVLNAFRLINPQQMMLGQEPRQTTSNIGYMVPPSKSALVHGLNRHYYQINHSYRKNQFEMQMLSNLHRRHWVEGLQTKSFKDHSADAERIMGKMVGLAKEFGKNVMEEETMTEQQLTVSRVGKQDPKRHLEANVQELLNTNIDQCLATMLDTIVF